jgi:hypothetical protein
LISDERHVGVSDILVDAAALEARCLKVVEGCLRDTTGLEHVVRYAPTSRSNALEHCSANGKARVRIGHDVQSEVQPGDREVVEVSLGTERVPGLIVNIVGDAWKRVAAHTGDDAVVRVTDVVVAPAAFDVTAEDVADGPGHTLRIDESIARDANRCQLLSRQERVVAINRVGVAEVTRRSDLRIGVVVHEHGFDIRMRARRDFIVSERTVGNSCMARS